MRIEYVIVAVLFLLDQLTKFLARSEVLSGEWIFLVFNSGGSLGLFADSNEAFIVLSVFAILLLGYGVVSTTHPESTGFAVVLAGVLGNGLDRVVFGAVTDFARFFDLFIFNLADVYITVGVVFLLLLELEWFKQLVSVKKGI